MNSCAATLFMSRKNLARSLLFIVKNHNDRRISRTKGVDWFYIIIFAFKLRKYADEQIYILL